MGKTVLKYIFAFCSLLLFISCGKISSNFTNDEVDYSDSKCWFEANQEGMNKKVDIFYVVPTCIWDYTDSLGQIQHNMDIFNTKQRQMVDPSIRLAKNVLSDSCNFFSPYYRQISMDSWLSLDTALIEKRFQLAYKDVVAAFRYYLNNYNQGRPSLSGRFSLGCCDRFSLGCCGRLFSLGVPSPLLPLFSGLRFFFRLLLLPFRLSNRVKLSCSTKSTGF